MLTLSYLDEQYITGYHETSSFSITTGSGKKSLIVTIIGTNTWPIFSVTWDGIPLQSNAVRWTPGFNSLEVWSVHNLDGIERAGQLVVTWPGGQGPITSRVIANNVVGTGLPLLATHATTTNYGSGTDITSGPTAVTTIDDTFLFVTSATQITATEEGNSTWQTDPTWGALTTSIQSGTVAPTVTTGYANGYIPVGTAVTISRTTLSTSASWLCDGVLYTTSYIPYEPLGPTELMLDFEPPEYTTGELDTQDEWIKLAYGNNTMEVTDDPTKIIRETQSLQINIDASSSWPYGYYRRYIPPTRAVTLQWTTYADFSSVNAMFSLQFWTNSFGNVTFIHFQADGMIGVEDATGSNGIGSYDMSEPHNFTFIVNDEGTTSLLRDGVEIYTGIAQYYQTMPDAKIGILHLFSAGVTDTVEQHFFLDDFVIYNNEEIPTLNTTLAKPTNVFAIRRDNYIIVSWDRVQTLADGTPLSNEDVDRYEVIRFLHLNENMAEVVARIITTDTKSYVDTVFRDISDAKVYGYKIRAVAIEDGNMLQSESDEAAVAIQLLSTIDDKTELVDQNLLILDKSNLNEGVLS